MLGLKQSLSIGKKKPATAAAGGLTNTYSLDFDGTNDHLLAATETYDNGSWSVWVKDRNAAPTSQMVLSTEFLFIYFDVNGNVHYYWPAGYSGYATFVIDEGERIDNEWHHLVITAHRPGIIGTSAEVKVYWDGVLKVTKTGTGSGAMSNKVLNFGRYYGGGYYWEGNIDELGWWEGVTLDADAVTALYNNGIPIDLKTDAGDYDNSSDLTHWWRCGDGDTYPTIEDNSGSIDLTMTNMVSGDIATDVPA